MNQHFLRGDRPPTLDGARSMWAQIERVEPPNQIGGMWLMALDAIGADWVREQGGAGVSYFKLDDRAAMKSARKQGLTKRLRGGQQRNPFEHAPLFRIELELPELWWRGMGAFGDEAVFESLWYHVTMEETPRNGLKANVYSNAFAPPLQAILAFQPVFGEMEQALADLVSLNDDFDAISEQELGALLGGKSAEALAVYHVGQGNANGLLGRSGACQGSATSVYYDLGCGVYANRGTTPTPLHFCDSLDPPVILSHWDSDHWMGVYAHKTAAGAYPFLNNDWVAPLQTVTTHHKAFALDVASHGSMRIYNPAIGVVGTANLSSPPNTSVRFAVGTGGGRNQSGIVLSVERDMGPAAGGLVSWLLTGDCDYRFFMPSLSPPSPVGLVVPHHGARRPTNHLPTPSPLGGNARLARARPYRRLVYSFGSGNAHGHGVSHPVDVTVAEHESQYWDCKPWSPWLNAGAAYPGEDTRATSRHSVAFSGDGVVVGWSAPPPLASGCTTCSTQCTQN